MAAGYNRKWRSSIRRLRKPHHRTKHEGGSDDALQSYGRLKFSQNVWIGPEVGRTVVVGRMSVVNIQYFLHWSHNIGLGLLLFRYVRNVAREE